MELQWVDGHVIVEEDGVRVLVDTGLPHSVGTLRNWSFQGVPVALRPSAQGATAEGVSRHLDTRIDVLLGMDFLGKRTVQVDVPGREFRLLHTTETLPTGRAVPLKLVGGVPTVPVMVGEEELRAVLRTGSKLSYLTDDLIRNHTTVGRTRDFHPVTGAFQSDLRLVSARLGVVKATLRCGILPPMVEAGLRTQGLRGIVGNDLLEQYVATFVMPGQVILTRA